MEAKNIERKRMLIQRRTDARKDVNKRSANNSSSKFFNFGLQKPKNFRFTTFQSTPSEDNDVPSASNPMTEVTTPLRRKAWSPAPVVRSGQIPLVIFGNAMFGANNSMTIKGKRHGLVDKIWKELKRREAAGELIAVKIDEYLSSQVSKQVMNSIIYLLLKSRSRSAIVVYIDHYTRSQLLTVSATTVFWYVKTAKHCGSAMSWRAKTCTGLPSPSLPGLGDQAPLNVQISVMSSSTTTTTTKNSLLRMQVLSQERFRYFTHCGKSQMHFYIQTK
jgi:hypothetical protein